MSKIGIFFGPERGSVDKCAHIIAKELSLESNDVKSIKNIQPADFSVYTHIIFGISTVGRNTWENEAKGNDWDLFAPRLKDIDFSNKTVAIFGLGDQLTYPEHFVNAISWLNENLTKLGVKTVGACSTDGYHFDDSEALKDGKFVGLPIDEDNEPELTQARVSNWVKQLIKEGF